MASAVAALGAAATRLDEATVPVADEVRETILGMVLTLVEDLLGRELALADSPVLDAVRRALALVPADAPAVVRVHPDDLGEIPAEALAELPESIRVVADPRDRAGRRDRRDRAPADRRPAHDRARTGAGGAGLVTLPSALMTRARAAARPQVTGSVSGAMGLTMTVDGLSAAVGDLVEVEPG